MKKNKKIYGDNGHFFNDAQEARDRYRKKKFIDKINVFMFIYPILTLIVIFLAGNYCDEGNGGFWFFLLFYQLMVVETVLAMLVEFLETRGFSSAFLIPLGMGIYGCFNTVYYHHHGSSGFAVIFLRSFILIPLIFALLGAMDVYRMIKAKYHSRFVCVELVRARCVDCTEYSSIINLFRFIGRVMIKYCATYRFNYNGKDYVAKSALIYDNRCIDGLYDFLVNPDHPREIYDPSTTDESVLSIIIKALRSVILPIAIAVLIKKCII